jgi:hypothetical protein
MVGILVVRTLTQLGKERRRIEHLPACVLAQGVEVVSDTLTVLR